MIITFNPYISGLRKRLLKYWNYTKQEEVFIDLSTTPPMIAYSKHKNIGDLIIRASLKSNVHVTPTDELYD